MMHPNKCSFLPSRNPTLMQPRADENVPIRDILEHTEELTLVGIYQELPEEIVGKHFIPTYSEEEAKRKSLARFNTTSINTVAVIPDKYAVIDENKRDGKRFVVPADATEVLEVRKTASGSARVRSLGQRFLALRKRNEFHFDSRDNKVINDILMKARGKHAAETRRKAEAAAAALRANMALPTSLRPNCAMTSMRPQWQGTAEMSSSWAQMAATATA